ncbi:MAG: LLM class flavin-dependent oxidoreductase [Acidimicrobiia bacterium]|nr:LLM class flavin-dependent oxidoreductase [Acidimicrobiia bacterium]
MPTRTMTLVGFMQASNVTVYAGAWRHPDADPDFLSARYYQHIAQVLEGARFDLLFFDDRLAMPGIYGDSVAETVRTGARCVKLDLSVTLGVIAAATEHIGLGATYSTTYYAPFHVARTFATLDHLSAGRAAWNVVTSVNDAEAQNYGVDVHAGHDERYDLADEFLEATTGLWDTWEDGAVVDDREGGVFADPAKVHELNYQGRHYRSRGPLTVPRGPQGRPVLIQAGSSGRGREFAARWADVIFVNEHTLELAQAHYADQRARIAAAGRDPDKVKILPLIYVVAAETEAEARAEEQRLLDLVDPMASLVLLGEVTNLDFSGFDIDEPIPESFLDSASGIRGFLDGVRAHLAGRPLTLRDLASHRATLRASPRFVGTGAQIADGLEEWLTSGACDGFVVAATNQPGTFEAFGRHVSPELQRRGLLRRDYEGHTLRENLGLARP